MGCMNKIGKDENKNFTWTTPSVRLIVNKTKKLKNGFFDSVGEGKGGMFQENSIKTCILSRVKQITSPGWMHETSARTWCTGKT